MDITKKFYSLKFYASTTDSIRKRKFPEYIILKAREKGLSGTTVFRGIMGFGSSSKVNTSKFWELTDKLPVIVEIIDEHDKLKDFFDEIEPELNEMTKGCMATFDPVSVIFHKFKK